MISTNDAGAQARRQHLADKLAERRQLITSRQARRRSQAHERITVLQMSKRDIERSERGSMQHNRMPLADSLLAYAKMLAELVPPSTETYGKVDWGFSADDKAAMGEMVELLSDIPEDFKHNGLDIDYFLDAYHGGEGGDRSKGARARVGRMIKKFGWVKRYLYREGKYVYLYFPPAKQYGRLPSTVEQC